MNDIEKLEKFAKALKELHEGLVEFNRILDKKLEGCPNGKEAVLKTV